MVLCSLSSRHRISRILDLYFNNDISRHKLSAAIGFFPFADLTHNPLFTALQLNTELETAFSCSFKLGFYYVCFKNAGRKTDLTDFAEARQKLCRV